LSTSLHPAPTTGDQILIERLVANLIDNAVRYNRSGGMIEVRTALDARGRPLLAVANTGAVVPADEVERLLQPFQRLDRDRTGQANGHHGLGLSIVRAIATAHGAALSARSQPAGGLSVTVSFPAAAGADWTTARGRWRL
jgi:signal transduction histidine kinase